MIHLESVTPDNWRCGLRVREDQKGFVAERAVILARAWAYREHGSRAFIIYDDDTPVGMAMYHDDTDQANACVFDQFFIDFRYQGRGFGLEAAHRVLGLIEEDGRFDKVYLCYIEGDTAARNLYEKLGFYETGFVEEGEVEMEKLLR